MIEVQDGIPVPPAWYPSPNEPLLLRWWDGARWTEHTIDSPFSNSVEPIEAFAVVPAIAERREYDPFPYSPMSGSSSRASASGLSDRERYSRIRTSTTTAWVWLLALTPAVCVALLALMPPTLDRVGWLGVPIVIGVLFAYLDVRALRAGSYTPISWGWAALPFVYLIGRLVVVGRSSIGPLILWAVVALGVVALIHSPELSGAELLGAELNR